MDAEIPAPESGILAEIKVPAGTTTQINTVVAVIRGGSGQRRPQFQPRPQSKPSQRRQQETPSAAPAAANDSGGRSRAAGEGSVTGSGERVRSSPLVRRIAKDNNLDLRQISGTGSAGRITKEDVLGFLAEGARAPSARPAAQPPRRPAFDAERRRARRPSRSIGSVVADALDHCPADG